MYASDNHRTAIAPDVAIAYVYGETPPDFAAIAACGFTIACVDSSASWCSEAAVAAARAEGLTVVPFRMSYSG